MLNSDPPRHTRLRSLVSKEFTLRRMEKYRPVLERVVDELLDALDDGRPVVDFVAGFSLPLPIMSICDLLGIPRRTRTPSAGGRSSWSAPASPPRWSRRPRETAWPTRGRASTPSAAAPAPT